VYRPEQKDAIMNTIKRMTKPIAKGKITGLISTISQVITSATIIRERGQMISIFRIAIDGICFLSSFKTSDFLIL
jgi:hypothetical protein